MADAHLLEKYLTPGERVVVATHRHWAAIAEPLATAVPLGDTWLGDQAWGRGGFGCSGPDRQPDFIRPRDDRFLISCDIKTG